MAFIFNWPTWPKDVMQEFRTQLQDAMNANTANDPTLVGKWKIEELDFGTVPPRLKLTAIHELSLHRAVVQFHFEYDGDFKFVGRNAVQTNKLVSVIPKYQSELQHSIQSLKSTILPISLTVQDVRVNGDVKVILDMDLDKQRYHLQVVLLNDPIQSITIKTNIEEEMPILKRFIEKMLQKKVREAISKVRAKPLQFEFGITEKKPITQP